MNPWLVLFFGSVVVCVLQRRRIIELRKENLAKATLIQEQVEEIALKEQQIRAQEQVAAEFLWEFSHQGPIPPASSLLGLIELISSGLKRSIERLENLYEKRDWNTISVISEMQRTVLTALRLTSIALDDYLKSRRNTTKKYELKQISILRGGHSESAGEENGDR